LRRYILVSGSGVFTRISNKLAAKAAKQA